MVLGEQGKWLGVWVPERNVEMACESGGRRWRGWRWAKVAGGVRGTMMSCQSTARGLCRLLLSAFACVPLDGEFARNFFEAFAAKLAKLAHMQRGSQAAADGDGAASLRV